MSVLDDQALAAALAKARAADQRVVFTNGAFDLLHGGHLSMLEAAAALGDVLVVGVNDDASVRRLRRPGRPVVRASERAALVAALGCVDHVVVFGDATVDRLLELVRPAVHAKGADYAEASLPERATNERLGIEMAFVGAPKAQSATRLAARAAAAAGAGVERVREFTEGNASFTVLDRASAPLRTSGWLDLERLVTTDEGVMVEGTAKRWVRRLEVAGTPVYVKVCRPRSKKREPTVELGNILALRRVGLRAPEPWLAAVGHVAEGDASALVTREAPGLRLDHWLRDQLASLGPLARQDVARGIGQAVRALHTARFVFPDLQAWHLLVDGSPAGGAASITFIDLMRLERSGRVDAKAAARGLAALALSLRPYTTERFRLAILRGYLGGTLTGPEGGARPYLKAIAKQVRKLEHRGTYRNLGENA